MGSVCKQRRHHPARRMGTSCCEGWKLVSSTFSYLIVINLCGLICICFILIKLCILCKPLFFSIYHLLLLFFNPPKLSTIERCGVCTFILAVLFMVATIEKHGAVEQRVRAIAYYSLSLVAGGIIYTYTFHRHVQKQWPGLRTHNFTHKTRLCRKSNA